MNCNKNKILATTDLPFEGEMSGSGNSETGSGTPGRIFRMQEARSSEGAVRKKWKMFIKKRFFHVFFVNLP